MAVAFWLDAYRASFETPAGRAPQDEKDLSVPSTIYLILKSA
jgi:hypothetical protein